MRNSKYSVASRSARGLLLGVALVAGSGIGLVPTALGGVKWRTGVSPAVRDMTPGDMSAAMSRELNGAPSHRVILHFRNPLTDADRADLAARGVKTLAYVGENAYFATVTPLAVAQLDQAQRAGGANPMPALRSVQPIMTAWKLHEDLNANIIQPWTVIQGGLNKDGKETDADLARDPVVAVSVMFHPDVDMNGEAHGAVAAAGGTVMGVVQGVNIMDVHIHASQIKALAAQDVVQWVEPQLPGLTELNANSRAKVGTDIVNAAPYNLNGAGVNVLVYDGGKVRATHVDFQGRVTIGPTDTSAVSDHSTHVAGTVGGAGVAVAANRGMAPGVTMQSYGFEMAGGLVAGFLYTFPGDLQADYTAAVSAGADIATNSIGTNTAPNGYDCTWEGNYGNTEVIIDGLVRGTPGLSDGNPLRIVWANGNERQTTRCFDAAVPAGYHTTAPPSCGKNHITCGATDATAGPSSEPVTSFTSWGPADDGRMKPDVSAPGNNVVSCSSSSDTAYATKSGTSMATPCVTGNSSLLMEDFRANYPSQGEMRNSLLKCFLAHTAQDLVNPGPDYQTGYGSIRIQPAVDLERSGNFGGGTVSQGGTVGFLVVVPPGNTQPLKITMAWDDVPGTPNVNPVLVNDLDLVVTSPSNVRAYPWTLPGLAGANTGNPAVQTAENHVDNIEQVYVAAPQEGVWQVTVRGTTVPSGPQPFSITATPLLVNCSDAGVAGLDKSVYPCSATANLRVVDCGLNTSDSVVDTVVVNIASNTNPAGKLVTLTEVGAATADFRGSITLASGPLAPPTALKVNHGDTVTLTYNDADSGGGSPAVVTATATIDCVGPAISGVGTSGLQPRSVNVNFSTNEMATPKVYYGTSCGSLTNVVSSSSRSTSHSVAVTGLQTNTTYYFRVEATDDAGNVTSNNNNNACFTFATPAVPDFFTELFTTNNDLDNRDIIFSPDASISQYSACESFPINALPVDPTGGVTLSTGDDSPSATVTLGSGHAVKLYGVSYTSFFVNPNGNITFTASDSSLTESYATHFNKPRISALFDDLNPTQAGTISYLELADRVAVTWLNVTHHNAANQNTFQIVMYYDGRIELAYLAIAQPDGLAGLSGSTSQNPDFTASDLTAYGTCGPRPPFAANASYTINKNNGMDLTLGGGDDGLPAPPALAFIVTSLPTNAQLKDIGANATITSVPYTVQGNQVRYKPLPGFLGADSFQFKTNDGGVPPDGGDSSLATVSLTVVDSGAGLPFSDQFPTTTFNAANWVSFGNATIDNVGIAEPSEPNSARFNGNPTATGDVIVSRSINLLPYSNLHVKYQFECRGGGESPDSGDDLFIDYLNSSNVWTNLSTHLGTLPDAVVYTPVDIVLPAAAKHGNFKLRIRSNGTAGAFDDWFVDDVEITGTACAGDANGDGTVNTADLLLMLGNFGDIAAGWSGGDFNGDGYIDTADLLLLLGAFGTTCS